MKFTIARDLLLQNLNHVSKAISTKPQMPVLTGIKIDVKEHSIILTSSNSDVSIQAKILSSNQVTIEETGSCLLPGKYLLDIVRKVEAKDIIFVTFEENMVKIIADKSTFTLNMMEKDLFPYISFEETPSKVTLDVLNLKQIIKKTSFATSDSESKMVLTGISLTTSGKKLEALATDSFRLAKKYMICDQENDEVNVIIPSKSLDELNKIIEDVEEKVEMFFSNTKVLFKYKNIVFLTRLIEGTFPNISSLIPTEYITSITFNKNLLISTIERASLFNVGDVSNVIKLTIKDKDLIEINSSNNEIGRTSEEITPIDCTNPIPLQIAFSSKWFLDAVRAFDSNQITIHFTGEIKPFIITGEYDVNHLQLILPTRSI